MSAISAHQNKFRFIPEVETETSSRARPKSYLGGILFPELMASPRQFVAQNNPAFAFAADKIEDAYHAESQRIALRKIRAAFKYDGFDFNLA